MAVTRWSAAALAELRSLEIGSTAVVAREIRRRAQLLAGAAGRQQVERGDLSEALVQYYAEIHPETDEDEPGEADPSR